MRTEEISVSERQVEIFNRHASGETEKAIAQNLGISINTVRYHKKKLFKYLDVNSTPEALCKLKDWKII